MIKAIFFDLDGTLLPLHEETFERIYFSLLCQKMMPYGYEPKQLMKTIFCGIEKMMANDGKKTNEEVFWDTFISIYGEEKRKDEEIFASFYTHEFLETKKACKENPLAKEIIQFCREHFPYVVLATNPIFPRIATQMRMEWIGLTNDDFSFVTTYENSCFSKPNPAYFQMLMKKFHLQPDEVLVFGNHEYEDGECAYQAQIKCYLIDHCLIRDERAKHVCPKIHMEDVIPILKKYISE